MCAGGGGAGRSDSGGTAGTTADEAGAGSAGSGIVGGSSTSATKTAACRARSAHCRAPSTKERSWPLIVTRYCEPSSAITASAGAACPVSAVTFVRGNKRRNTVTTCAGDGHAASSPTIRTEGGGAAAAAAAKSATPANSATPLPRQMARRCFTSPTSHTRGRPFKCRAERRTFGNCPGGFYSHREIAFGMRE